MEFEKKNKYLLDIITKILNQKQQRLIRIDKKLQEQYIKTDINFRF